VSTSVEPLRLSLDVDCEPVHAFAVWTEKFSLWWPADHTVTGEPALVALEPRLGGRIYERSADGTEHEWGEITIWEPPERLGYLWHLLRDRADATDVEISFRPHGSGTRVEIEHRGWERLGTDADLWRTRNQVGWSTLLPHYRQALAER
jgi:uncharacterized protein YndB with AHSA1/START domain